MRWFKHDSNMRNDHFIQNLRIEFGLNGYAIYCMLLEIFSHECGNDPSKEIELNWKVLLKEIGCKRKTIENVISFCTVANKFVCFTDGNILRMRIPKMAQLRDNYSKNLQGTGNNVPTNKKQKTRNKIQDKDKEKENQPVKKPVKKSFVAKDDWHPKENFKTWLKENHPSVDTAEYEHQRKRFIDYGKSKGVAYTDHDSAFRNWFNSPYYKPMHPPQAGKCAIRPATEYKQTGVVSWD